MTLVGPDGLPMFSSGVSTEPLTHVVNDLSITYPACTTPDPGSPACSAGVPGAPCDFESGQVSWSLPSLNEQPTARVTLRDVGGTSPLCTKGTYLLEATSRETRMCGPVATAVSCTLVDHTVALPLVA